LKARGKKPTRRNSLEDKPKPILEHFRELRIRLIVSILSLIITATIAWWFSDYVIMWLTGPVSSLGVPPLTLHFTTITEAFGTRFMIAIIGGLVLSTPVLIFEICMFILPGLLSKERKVLFAYLPLLILLFLVGSGFAAYPIVPWTRQFFLGFQAPNLMPIITISSYIDFSLMLILGMGLIFLLPVVILMVTSLRLVSPFTIGKWRKFVWVIILIAAAAIAPDDGISMLIVAIPVVFLFEISLFVARAKWRKQSIKKGLTI